MNARKQEWKLTQYVLGEMDAAEAARLEKELERDPALRAELAELRETARLLTGELKREPLPELSEEERRSIARGWQEKSARPRRSPWLKWTLGLTPVAAALVGLFSVYLMQREMGGLDPREWVMEQAPAPKASQEAPPRQPPPAAVKPAPEAQRMADFPGALRKKGAGGAAPKPPAPPTGSSAGPQNLQIYSQRLTEGESSRGRALIGAAPRQDAKPEAKRAKKRREAPATAAAPRDEANEAFQTESYDRVEDNAFKKVADDPLSTFSADVDTASYANVRRFLNQGRLPPPDAVRIEEMVNYFPYRYDPPTGRDPFAVHTEVTAAPWAPEHRLVRIGIKGKEIKWEKRAPSNLVFLLDVSGSMDEPNKLPLVKEAMRLLVDKLSEKDRISVVVYAGSSGLVLPPTPGNQKKKILDALDNLKAGGSTNGGQGIELAYKTAQAQLRKGGINRVILATDGDFNVGTSSTGDLTRLIEQKARSGVFLTVLGFGMGNYKDSMLEKLADKGNGNYAYIDSSSEAKKVFVQEIGGTLMTIAKDVKLQVEFNPAQVDSYRLIGYENRVMAHQDFNDDKKDAGDIGAGHTVTALYEVVPAGKGTAGPGVDALRYQKGTALTEAAGSGELLTLKLRYKEPEGSTSRLLSFPVKDGGKSLGEASRDLKFAAAVASFGMILRDSPHKGKSTYEEVLDLATPNRGEDTEGYRREFIGLVEKARSLKK